MGQYSLVGLTSVQVLQTNLRTLFPVLLYGPGLESLGVVFAVHDSSSLTQDEKRFSIL